jgi:glucose-6-phosphate-specific signal transduction histidine kinase
MLIFLFLFLFLAAFFSAWKYGLKGAALCLLIQGVSVSVWIFSWPKAIENAQTYDVGISVYWLLLLTLSTGGLGVVLAFAISKIATRGK